MRVFMSGAVEGLKDEGMGWRHYADKLLSEVGYTAVFPSDVPHDADVKEIVENNRFFQRSCDIVLAEYMIPNRAYIGTDYELVCAQQWNQPSVVVAHEMYRERVYLRYLATRITSSIEEAIDYIAAYYPIGTRGKK